MCGVRGRTRRRSPLGNPRHPGGDPRISRRAQSYHHPRPLPLASSDHEGRLRNHHSCVAYAPSSLPISLTLSHPQFATRRLRTRSSSRCAAGRGAGVRSMLTAGVLQSQKGPIYWRGPRGALYMRTSRLPITTRAFCSSRARRHLLQPLRSRHDRICRRRLQPRLRALSQPYHACSLLIVVVARRAHRKPSCKERRLNP